MFIARFYGKAGFHFFGKALQPYRRQAARRYTQSL